ncbi:hypothetical protein F4167_07600, partial [Candidatus Poribacteria bacterium]|nr:hypothetical protein [Candidatus Poribacteria bacterium]
MKVRFFVFLFLFLFIVSPVFSATSTTSGSGSKPEMKFDSWRVGRSPTGTNINSDDQKSFITSSETECWLEASVVYKGGTQPKNSGISPIDPDTVKWTLDEGLLKGWALAEPPGTSWSGSHPSKLSGSTSFNVVAKFSLPKYNDKTHYTISAYCSHSDANRRSRNAKHRSGERIKINVKFSAKTYSGELVSLTLPLLQDEKDQLRQEYLDLTREIPSRGTIKDVDGDFNNFGKVFYDFGHYDVMLYEDLNGKHGAWTTSINVRERRPNSKPDFTRSDLFVTNGFRNPHHNDHHARETTKRATTDIHGLHQYGLALDVRGRDFDVDGDGNYGDQEKMRLAALNATPPAKKAFAYSTEKTAHVHADWRGSGWPPSNPIPAVKPFQLPPQSTDPPSVVKPEDKKDDDKPSGNLVLLPSSGSSEVTAGESYTVDLTTKYPFEWVKFYVKKSGASGYGTLMKTVMGSSSSESASFTYTFPSSASGAYEIIAVVNDFSDSSVYEASVSVSVAAAAPVEKKDGVILECGHEDDGSNDHFKIPYTCCAIEDWWCLKRHGRQECPKDAKNRACIVEGGFMWKCNPHEHKYPSDVVIKPPDPKQVIKKTTDPKQTVFPKDDPPKETKPDPPPDPKDDKVTPKEDRKEDRVPPKVKGDCNVHDMVSSELSKHTSVNYSCGVHSYYACQPPSRAEVSRHTSRTLPCGAHTGYLCTASSSHTISKPCPVKNGVACSYGSYYPCSPHTHAYVETKPRVQYQSCGNHLTTVSGDHSYVALCRETNSNGDSCTNPSGYYACSVHVHSFPDPP